jgi:PAS domain S-box-containing protein
MFDGVYGGLTEKYDPRLIGLAGIVCIFASFTAVDLLVRGQESVGRRRRLLFFGTAAILGTGLWAAHFVGELAFEPGLPIAYNTGFTALSLVIAITLTWPGVLVAARWRQPLVGGGIIGLAIGAMHYAGMAALRVPADLHWNYPLVGASLVIGIMLASAATAVASRGSAWRYRLTATALFAAAILALHFIAMAALALVSDPLASIPTDIVPAVLLAWPVAVVTLSIVLLAMSMSIADQQASRRAAREAEELRRSKEHLALAQRVASTGSFELDLETRAIAWSDETYRIFGISPEIGPLNQAFLEELVVPEDRQRLREQIAAVASSGRSAPECEYRIRRPDGSVRSLHREIELAPDAAGRPQKLVGVVRDVTELREAERRNAELERQLLHAEKLEAERLRRSQEQLERVLRISGVGCIERELSTGHMEWSKEACRIFGLPSGVSPSRERFYECVHPDDRAMVKAAVERSNTGVPSPPLEYRVVRPDGEVRFVYRENDMLFDGSGVPICRVSTFKDVTEIRAAQLREKELERQLMHAQKVQALGTLAGGVAHDLNNTLVPILALSNLALEELPEESPLHADLETILHASERARDLVKQILAFSRKEDVVREPVDLAAVAREALRMLRASLPASIRIEQHLDPVPRLFGNAGELQQAIVNLVTNAAQAIGAEPGRIAVSVGPLPQVGGALGDDAPSVRLSVADTGCGIDAATLDRVFEPFFTTKPVGGGTGLGLSIAHGIVTRHGGRIDVRSQPGQGSEFTMILPAVAQPRTKGSLEIMVA